MFYYARMMLGTSNSHLDSWSVTVGGTGTAPGLDRTRGFSNLSYGSITPTTSALYGLTVQAINYDENLGAPFYQLSINSAPNSGWTTLNIGSGAKILTRASATSFLSGTWKWTTADVPGTAFGAIASVKTVTLD